MRTVLCCFVAAAAVYAGGPAPTRSPGDLQVEVVAGGGASNNPHQPSAHPVTVCVRDREGKPVADATVTAILPATGPGAAFAWGSEISSKQTDSEGLATFRGMRLRPLEGEFPIRIVASSNGSSSSVTALQSVRASAPAPAVSGWSKRKMIMFGIVGGGTAAAILAATTGGSSKPTTSGPVTGGLIPGYPITTGPR